MRRDARAATCCGIDTLGPLDDRVPLDVDAATPGAAGELRVLPGRDRDARLAVELLELFQHDRPGGHVDAQGKRLGGEHDLHELALEQVLHDFLERGKQSGMVRGHAPLEVVKPLPVPENGEVLVVQRARALLHDGADLGALLCDS